MRIGILKTDSVREEFQDEFGDYPAMFMDLLTRAAAPGEALDFTVYDVEHGVYPASLDACDGYVITGSRRSVYEEEPWIRRFAAFVRELVAARVPLVGICFGHQMIAHALDGETGPADGGWGVGRKRMRLVAREPWMGEGDDELGILASHKDQVLRMPTGARLLATADYCPIAAYAIGDHALAIQGHPEFVPGYSRALIGFRREILGEETWRAGLDSLTRPPDNQRIGRMMLDFLAAARDAATRGVA